MRLFIWLVFGILFADLASADEIKIGAQKRQYQLVSPPDSFSGPRPTIFILHGGGGTGARVKNHLDFQTLAQSKGVLLVYPNGLGKHWDDGRKSKAFDRTSQRDMVFLTTLAQNLIDQGKADANQVFVVGISNGGMMTQRLLCEASQTFKAGAVLIANLPEPLKTCQPKFPRPVLFINGDADPLMPWTGGGTGFRARRGNVLSGPATFSHWAKLNGCKADYTSTSLPNRNPDDKSRAVRWHAKGCAKNNQVDMIVVLGGGHSVPRVQEKSNNTKKARRKKQRQKRWERILGPINRDFSARDAIWKFLFATQ